MLTTAIFGLMMVLALIASVVILTDDIHKYKACDNSQDDFTAFEGVWQRSFES